MMMILILVLLQLLGWEEKDRYGRWWKKKGKATVRGETSRVRYFMYFCISTLVHQVTDERPLCYMYLVGNKISL